MTNDAKLGMLAGVLGVIVAAVLFANTPQPDPSQPSAAVPLAKDVPPTAAATPPEAGTAALPSTPVARTRKDVDAQPASRQGSADEEP